MTLTLLASIEDQRKSGKDKVTVMMWHVEESM
jgi:hypothetical protein